MIFAERADEIELKNGVVILIKPSDFRAIRGLTIVCCVADEISFWDAVGANPDREVLAAIRPGMMTIPTSKLLCISTPYAESGAMFEAWKSYYGKDDADEPVWRADSLSMNPTLSAATIQKEIDRDPEAGRRILAVALYLLAESIAAEPLSRRHRCND